MKKLWDQAKESFERLGLLVCINLEWFAGNKSQRKLFF